MAIKYQISTPVGISSEVRRFIPAGRQDRGLALDSQGVSAMIVSSLILAIGLVTFVDESRPEDVVSQPPALDQFVIVPLRAHIFTSTELDLANCKLRDADITRIVGKLNSIWNKAGIHFGLESIVREQPAQAERFTTHSRAEEEGKLEITDFAMLLPKPSRVFYGLQVFFFHELPFNGAYLGDDCTIVQERAALNEVKGGSDEPIPRVLGFSFGRLWGFNRVRASNEPARPGYQRNQSGRDRGGASQESRTNHQGGDDHSGNANGRRSRQEGRPGRAGRESSDLGSASLLRG